MRGWRPSSPIPSIFAARPRRAGIPQGRKYRSASIASGRCLEPELAAYSGRVVAFEPDGESFTQYFFVGREDFAAAGLRPEVAAAIEKRVEHFRGACAECGGPATWLWISRREVSSLDQTERIEESPGAMYCAKHGAAKLREVLGKIDEANLFYVNAPYSDSGAYVWI